MIHPEAFVHPQALVDDGASIGPRTRVWAFCHVLPGAVVGADCNLCDHTFIEGGVRLGDRVTVKSGVYLWEGIAVEDDVFLGPAAAFTNDPRPRSGRHLDEYPRTLIERGATIGANATVLPGLTIGAWSLIGAGAVVTRDVQPHALVLGAPASARGWVCRCGQTLAGDEPSSVCECGLAWEHGEGPPKPARGES